LRRRIEEIFRRLSDWLLRQVGGRHREGLS
jgi:hypothetical protein